MCNIDPGLGPASLIPPRRRVSLMSPLLLVPVPHLEMSLPDVLERGDPQACSGSGQERTGAKLIISSRR